MAKSLLEDELQEYLNSHTLAKNPVNPEVFKFIPFFEDVFPKPVWSLLVHLGGNDGVAYIEHKKIPPQNQIIRKGDFDMMVYWLLQGSAEVKAMLGNRPTIVKRYNAVGHCFGEMALIDETERNADVFSDSKEGATILEIDWSITNISHELQGKFNQLLLKTVSKKLLDSYEVSKKAYMALMKLKGDVEKQHGEIVALKKMLITHGADIDPHTSTDLTERISEITEELDEKLKQS